MMADELAKLPAEDQVAIVAVSISEDEKRVWLSDFTSDRAQLAAALARVPNYIGEPKATENAAKDEQKHRSKGGDSSVTLWPRPKKLEAAWPRHSSRRVAAV